MAFKIPQSARAGAAVLLGVAGIWGATLSFTKEAQAVVGINEFLALRFAVAALVLVPFLPKIRKGSISLANTSLSIVLGGVLYGIFYLQSAGLKMVTTAATGFITGTNVVMVPLIASLLFRSKVSRRIWLGILVTMVGLGFVAGGGLLSPTSGYWLVLLSAFLIAVDIIAVEKIMGSIDATWLAFVEIVTVVVISSAFSFSGVNAGFGGAKAISSLTVVLALVFNGVLGTAFALWAQNYYQVIVPSAQVAVIFSTEPIFAAIVARLFFGGIVTLNVIFGGMLVLFGVTIADEEAFGYVSSKFLRKGGKSH